VLQSRHFAAKSRQIATIDVAIVRVNKSRQCEEHMSRFRMAHAYHSDQALPLPDTALACGFPHVLHESRHEIVVIVAIRIGAALLLGHAIAYRTALTLGNN